MLNNNKNIRKECSLCPRLCRVDRSMGEKGYCSESNHIRIARAALHMWEEPCISGERGSGAVFFSGCTLKCVFCQNEVISRSQAGEEVSIEHLKEIFFELQEQKANNINLVTADHFIPEVAVAIKQAKQEGLYIPIVYNCSGYENVSALRLLEGLVDVYMPDMKYYDLKLGALLSKASDYPKTAKAAIAEMYRQVGHSKFSSEDSKIEAGIMIKGVLVRHLVLPGHVKDSMRVVKYLYDTYGDNIYISVMNQYTPMPGIERKHPRLGVRLSSHEYNTILEYCRKTGISNCFVQEGDTVGDSFIPEFNGKGIKGE